MAKMNYAVGAKKTPTAIELILSKTEEPKLPSEFL
jgi:hypothetical protein